MRFAFCVACLASKDLHHHHLIPKSKGGSDDEQNQVTLCASCHHSIHGREWSGVSHQKLTKDAMDKMKAERKQWTREAYGWRFKDGKAYPMKREQKIIKEILERRAQGETYPSIASELNKRGVKAKNGGEWGKSSVRSAYLANI